MRRTSPSTRIIGGRPADRCRSDALFLTENASSSAISMRAPLHCDWTRAIVNTGAAQPPAGSIAPLLADQSSTGRHELTTCAPRPAGMSLQRIENAARPCGRPVPRLLAVSQDAACDGGRGLAAAGQRAFGENYVQEAAAKQPRAGRTSALEWHLIGHLQSNKAARRRSTSTGCRPSTGPSWSPPLAAASAGRARAAERADPGQHRRRGQQAGCAPGRRARRWPTPSPRSRALRAARADGDPRRRIAGPRAAPRRVPRACATCSTTLRAPPSRRSTRCRWA